MSADAEQERVVITGLGVVSSIGTGVDDFCAGLRAGRSGAKPITAFDTTGFAHAIGCEVSGFSPQEWLEHLEPEGLGRATQFAVAGARMALVDAGLGLQELRRRRALVSIGTSDGETRDLDTLTEQQLAHGALDPVLAGRLDASRLASGVVRELELRDVETMTTATACAAGNYAIGSAFDALRVGDVDVALCGGADAVCRKTFTGFYRFGTIAPEMCQPFDRDRKGLLASEGSGVLVLETLRSARARGARIYAEVLGYGLNCDAGHAVAPDQDSLARCMRLAQANAGVKPEDVDLISAHGTGTPTNDVVETSAIRQVFDVPPPTVSVKSMIGHAMGAASALAAVACALAIREGFIPPTINHTNTDPDCGLDCVPNQAREAVLNVVQNNALAFAGNNVVLLLGRHQEVS
ncbi:beta-ketoacyl-[acyl-carrier-protein] synthase family protein [Streptomyces aurantiacus]|uniref:Putative 3-oxoacyl-[acyl-carrier-protein] synthase 2 n=1 Tax=Streptomyces aurantiacus JA 4570 TaxID=1286094 RepID=S3ZMX6_9ACTN|nr:beta-ketoacyl-[acyl-carrier-protein] synthase family protein [Streptomyces aurantiacus]EPH44543.1 putative 3-oxoacyl-[acyl-carrier-protein] synthase 2 [Streptomyces aurantiacus JA 4570]